MKLWWTLLSGISYKNYLCYLNIYQLTNFGECHQDTPILILWIFFWGYLKNLVYKTPINILEGLVKKIVVSCKTLRNTQGLFERGDNSMRIRGEAWLLIIESRNFQPFKNNINFGLITSLNRCNRSSFIYIQYTLLHFTARFGSLTEEPHRSCLNQRPTRTCFVLFRLLPVVRCSPKVEVPFTKNPPPGESLQEVPSTRKNFPKSVFATPSTFTFVSYRVDINFISEFRWYIFTYFEILIIQSSLNK